MKHKLLIAAAGAALLAVPSMAMAQDTGWYLKGQAGYGVMTDADIIGGEDSAGIGTIVGDIQGQGNLALGIGAGYDFGNWRVEVDGSQLYNDMGAIGNFPQSFAKARISSAMLNAIYDFSDFGRWEPYVGGGIGFAETDMSLVAHDFINDAGNTLVRNPACIGPAAAASTSRSCEVDDVDTSFAWNLLVGLGYKITDNLTWDTNYKYLDVGDVDLDGAFRQTAFGGAQLADLPLTARVEDLAAHSVMTGFRYRFGASTPPPPPPPPAPTTKTCPDGAIVAIDAICPAPPPPPPPSFTCWDGSTVTDLALCPAQPTFTCWDGSIVSDLAICPPETRSGVTTVELCSNTLRQEIIYYEFDRGQSAETRNTINRILDIGEFCDVNSIRVVGHTDTSGSAAYNLNLSKRRAKDARDELVRQGINPAVITSEGKGETEPFVQTGDGVKEQLNRRTEVLLMLNSTDVMMNN